MIDSRPVGQGRVGPREALTGEGGESPLHRRVRLYLCLYLRRCPPMSKQPTIAELLAQTSSASSYESAEAGSRVLRVVLDEFLSEGRS